MSEIEQTGETGADRLEEMRSLLEQSNSELSKSRVRIAELEETVSHRDNEISAARQALTESASNLVVLKQSLAEAVGSYRALVIETNPGVVAGLISGDDIAAINDSLQKAQALVSRVRQGIEAEIAQTRVPAGAPQRTPPDLAGMSPAEKIQYALGGRK